MKTFSYLLSSIILQPDQRQKVSKAFFFEKKNQKTFAILGIGRFNGTD